MYGAVVLLALYVVMVVGWAIRPLHDSVPVGTDWSPTVAVPPKAQRQVSQRVSCNSLFADSPRGNDQLPTLTPQPEGRRALAYEREPCDLVQRDARLVFALDSIVTLVLLAGLLVYAVRKSEPHADDPVGPSEPVVRMNPVPSHSAPSTV